MMSLPELLNQPDTTVALVGASDAPEKYGRKILRNLRAKGFTVYPVNRNSPTIGGLPAYAELSEIPERPTIINVVVPPPNGPDIIRQVAALGWDNVWFQPGAESEQARLVADELGITIIDNACTMVVARPR